jgi:hypothetical protein
MMQWVKPKGSQKQQDVDMSKKTFQEEKADEGGKEPYQGEKARLTIKNQTNEKVDPIERLNLNEKAEKNRKPKVPNKVLPAFYTDPRSSEHDDGASREERDKKKKFNEKKTKEQTDVAMRLLANSEMALTAIGLSLADIPRKYHTEENKK